jgi:hypothetical protein
MELNLLLVIAAAVGVCSSGPSFKIIQYARHNGYFSHTGFVLLLAAVAGFIGSKESEIREYLKNTLDEVYLQDMQSLTGTVVVFYIMGTFVCYYINTMSRHPNLCTINVSASDRQSNTQPMNNFIDQMPGKVHFNDHMEKFYSPHLL